MAPEQGPLNLSRWL